MSVSSKSNIKNYGHKVSSETFHSSSISLLRIIPVQQLEIPIFCCKEETQIDSHQCKSTMAISEFQFEGMGQRIVSSTSSKTQIQNDVHIFARNWIYLLSLMPLITLEIQVHSISMSIWGVVTFYQVINSKTKFLVESHGWSSQGVNMKWNAVDPSSSAFLNCCFQ